MMTNQLRGVDRPGRSLRSGPAVRAEHCPAIRPRSHIQVKLAVLALLIAVALAGRETLVRAQTQEPPAGNSAEPVADKEGLSQRYHLLERYAAREDPTHPELLTQYQVAYKETVKVTREKPQGAPDRDHVSTHCIYTERVAKLAKGGFVTDVVRRYDKVNLVTSLEMPRYKTGILQGLSVLLRLQPQSLPQVVSLKPDRQFRQQEFILVVQQAFLPALAGMLPRKPVRVGDTWAVPREIASALLGEAPTDEDYDLTAEILEVHKKDAGPEMIAAIGIKGQAVVSEGPSRIGARLHFTFVPAAAAPPRIGAEGEPNQEKASVTHTAPAGRLDPAIESRGYISKILMAQEITVPLDGNGGRLKQNVRRDLVLERHLNQPGDLAALLEVPSPEPVADVKNSWLIYDDPQGRFNLLYPQEFHVAKVYPEGGIDLLDRRPDGPDVIQISLVAKTGDQGRDRVATDPGEVKRQLDDQWKQRGERVMPGPLGWLPKSEWAPLKREVYRIEAALIPEGDKAPASGRVYVDHYIVKFTRNEVLVVEAITTRESHLQFRDTAESIIKSFEFGPSEGSLPSAPTAVRRSAPMNVPATPPANVPRTPRPR